MGLRIVRDVTGKLRDISVLRDLDHFRKQFSSVRETAYLKDFAALKTFDAISNPKYIIRDTLITYLRNVCDIYKQSDLLQVLIFTFYDDEALYTFEYSNNMMFNDDITILCFLHYKSYDSYSKCDTIEALISLMKNKYGIRERKVDNTESTQNCNNITLQTIVGSYPSISFDMAIKMGIGDKFSHVFDLPKTFLLHNTIWILPILDQPPPFAILMFVALKLVYNKTNIPLYSLFAKLYMCSKRLIFPQRFKLELCLKWQIVVKRKKMCKEMYEKKCLYEYAPCFLTYRQKAKDMIAEMKSNDPDLASILSRL